MLMLANVSLPNQTCKQQEIGETDMFVSNGYYMDHQQVGRLRFAAQYYCTKHDYVPHPPASPAQTTDLLTRGKKKACMEQLIRFKLYDHITHVFSTTQKILERESPPPQKSRLRSNCCVTELLSVFLWPDDVTLTTRLHLVLWSAPPSLLPLSTMATLLAFFLKLCRWVFSHHRVQLLDVNIK